MNTRSLIHIVSIILAALSALVAGKLWFPSLNTGILSSGSMEQLLQATGLPWLLLHAGIVSSFLVLQVVKSLRDFNAKILETNLQSALVFLALVSTAWTMFPVFQNNLLGQPDAGDQISPYLAKLYAKLIVTFGALLLCYCAGLIQEFWAKSIPMFGRFGSFFQFAILFFVTFVATSLLTGFTSQRREEIPIPSSEIFTADEEAEPGTEVPASQMKSSAESDAEKASPSRTGSNEATPVTTLEFEEKVEVDTQRVDESLTKSLTGFTLPENVYFDFSSYDTRGLYPAFLYQQGNKFLIDERWIETGSDEGKDLLKRYPERPVISLPNNRQLLLNTQVLNTLVNWLEENASFFKASQEIRFQLRKSNTRIQLITPSSTRHPSQTLLIH